MTRTRRSTSLLLSLVAACGDDGAPARDAGTLDASLEDTGAPDAGEADGGPLPSPRPVAPETEPVPLVPAQWFVAGVTNPAAGDPVMDQIEDGSFEVPPGDGVFRGVDWVAITPGAMGELRAIPTGYLYATATLSTPETGGVIVRADTCLSEHLGTQRQPGDYYATRARRVPLRTEVGGGAFVARCFGGRGAPEVQLWTSTDELWMNLADVTAPDLLVGDATEQWLGVPILNLTDTAALDATARVVESDTFEETATPYPSLAPGAVTQVAFRLRPKAPYAAPTDALGVRVRIESDSMRWSYEREVTLRVIEPGAPYRFTFRSRIDGSAQFMGVNAPSDPAPADGHALALSLHGAGVDALGQAQAYGRKTDTFVVAATNRRPFGFDWEKWGRLDALEVLDVATDAFGIDPTRIYLTGHSMGGHGTWQVGTLHPGRFAVIGPSAGWSSFYSYTGRARPTGAFARAQASSDTNVYAPTNLARRAVYVIHGDADDNVPVREARDMVALLGPTVMDLSYHEEPGAGHWWDGDRAPGADCVDWPELFDTMAARRLDPVELDFAFVSPSPWVSATHSYVTMRAALDPMMDVRIESATTVPGEVTLTTTNVRGLVLDGDALGARGVARVIVDGAPHTVVAGAIPIGAQDGKFPGVHGPFDEVLMRPFCFAYPDGGAPVWRHYASYLVSAWAVIGNGHACALPISEVDDALRAERNVIYVGAIPTGAFEGTPPFALAADGATVSVGATTYDASALWMTFPLAGGARLGGAVVATAGSEHLMFRVQPFTSGLVLPDYLVLGPTGARAAGFLDATWSLP